MNTSSNDPNAPNPKPELDSTEQPPAEKATTPTSTVGRSGPAALLAAALAAAGAAQAGAAVPAAAPDRAHLEALLHGSWTQPPDLNIRGLPPGTEIDPAKLADEFGAAFNDTYNPNPKPYSDKTYADSGFGDRSN